MSSQKRVIPLQFMGFQVPLTIQPHATRGPMALVLPALGVPASKYSQLLTTLGERGYHTAICEMPGTGESHPKPARGVDYGYSDLVFDWIPLVLQTLQQETGQRPKLILGHSIGGQVATLATRAGLTGDSHVVSVASGHLDSRSWRGLKRAAVVGAALTALTSTRILGYFPGSQLRFGGREAATLMRDWGNGIIRGRFTPEYRIDALASHSANNSANKSATTAAPFEPGQSLHLSINGDPFAPINATRRLAELVAGEVREIAPSFGKGNPHLSWIRNPGPVVEEIVHWIECEKATAPELQK